MQGIRLGMQGIRVGMWRISVGIWGIRVGMRGMGVGLRGIEWNINRKKQKNVFKIQIFFPEIKKNKKKNKIRTVIKLKRGV